MMFLAALSTPLLPDWAHLRPLLPDLWLVGTMVAVLLTPFFTRRPNRPCAAVTLVGLIAALLTLATATGAPWPGEMLLLDPLAIFWKGILLLFTAGVVLLWFSAVAPTMHEGDGPEFFVLLLGATLGLSLMGSTANLLMIAMTVELASLPSYVLAGFRKSRRQGAEASLKYVLFGAAASSVMIYGLSLLYGVTGSLQFGQVAAHLALDGGGGLTLVALAAVFVGIGFKIAAVPFHLWCPDVFEGANVEVSAFLSVASKGAGLVLLVRLLALMGQAGPQGASAGSVGGIAVILGVIGAITATVGNTGALIQDNIKRLLGYSSIAHAGYMLCLMPLMLVTTGPARQAAAQALLIYLAVYLFMNLGAFTVAAVIQRHTGAEQIEGYGGMSRRAPILAATMAIFMVSLIGLPPFAGFIAKLNVMLLLAKVGGAWWSLVAIIAINTLLSVYYYLRVVRQMYFRPTDAPPFHPNPLGSAMAVACAAMLLLMLIFFAPFSAWTGRYASIESPPPPAVTASAR